MKNSKTWSILCVALALVLLITLGSATAVIDPFFHYHAPLDSLQYPINNQRYQNDGIVRHFEYDALITGTSMTENFKTSEFDALFGVDSVKVSYSGGTYAEMFSNLQRAMESNPNIKTVIFCIDEWFLFSGRDMILADGEYPTYLYDDNPFNDVEYVLNKEILCSNTLEVLDYTRQGNTTTSFDDYGSWVYPYDAEVVLSNYQRPDQEDTLVAFTEENAANLTENLRTTALALAQEYPQTEFIYYFPPYSILNWDSHARQGSVQRYVEAFSLASSLLLEAENIRLFSFYTDYETITDLNNYRDTVHHSDAVNSLLLQRFAAGEYELTKENYEAHWQEVLEFYSTYDYDGLWLQ
ncbi:MAG: hypothetical protein IJ422_08800 [Oscillospiraceae bacterium]|nr:hypothetical protein [Oscillospiraceae bacterium]